MKCDSRVIKAARCTDHVFFGAVCKLPSFLINHECVCLSSQCFQFYLMQVQHGLFSFSYFLKVDLLSPTNLIPSPLLS